MCAPMVPVVVETIIVNIIKFYLVMKSNVLDGTKRANLINSTCKNFLTTLINCFIRKHLFLNIFTLDKRLVVRLRAALFMRLAL